MASEIQKAIKQICDEKNISEESVIETIEAALAVAYRKDFGEKNQNVKVEFNPETAQARVFDVKTVVEDISEEELEAAKEKEKEEREKSPKQEEEQPAEGWSASGGKEKKKLFNPKTEIMLSEAIKLKKDVSVGDEVRTELFPPEAYGRMAAQTAKQVIIQKLREAERDVVYQEYKTKEGEIVNGTIQRIEGRVVLVDIGQATAIMPPQEQIERENYSSGQRAKVYIVSVNKTTKGPEIIVSRSHPEMVKKLFTVEVPEIASGAIEIKAVAREAGSRSKIAVQSKESNIDPIGSCVGQRGTRVQTVIAELGGEKIDIIEYSEDSGKFIINALSPAKVLSVRLDEKENRATAKVKEDQLSLAIGRNGQNVRLSAKLTGWKIDIVKEEESKMQETAKLKEKEVKEKPARGWSASGGKETEKDKDQELKKEKSNNNQSASEEKEKEKNKSKRKSREKKE